MRLSDSERLLLESVRTSSEGRWLNGPEARTAENLIQLGFLRQTGTELLGSVVSVCVITYEGRMALQVDEGRLRLPASSAGDRIGEV